MRVVDGLDDAIAHIRRYGSDHTEVIATRDEANAERFVQSLRAAVVMVNASSRFSDGGELGLGAEIGISTTRLHAYGPMGLEALTVERFVVRGAGRPNLPNGLRLRAGGQQRKSRREAGSVDLLGRGDRIRTCDLYVPNVALYQTELHPDCGAAHCSQSAPDRGKWRVPYRRRRPCSR